MASKKNRPRSLKVPTTTFNFVLPTASLDEVKKRAEREQTTPGSWVRKAVDIRLHGAQEAVEWEDVIDVIRNSSKLSLRYADGTTQGDAVAEEVADKIRRML